VEKITRAINERDALSAALELSRCFFPRLQVDLYRCHANLIVEQCRSLLGKSSGSATSDILSFCDLFYQELAFSGDTTNLFRSRYCLLDQVIEYRTGIPVTLTIMFCYVGRQLGFQLDEVNFPGHFLIRFTKPDNEFAYINPANGKLLTRAELGLLHRRTLGEEAVDDVIDHLLSPASVQEALIGLLHNLKASFINEKLSQFALKAADLLVQLCPEDPYERRDRGLLLQQLDCLLPAIQDYQYFIEKCPADPVTPLLINQLKDFSARPSVILH
jgi:regulator of sirC expression with transglutaminase-like and TPR domain